MSAHIVDLPREALRARMGEALTIYVSAMGYPRGSEAHRAPMWAEHTLRSGWQAVAALQGPASVPAASPLDTTAPETTAPETTQAPLLGIAYGYRGARRQWWCEEVRAGLLANSWSASTAEALLEGYFELTELHVLPVAQGLGLGEQLLRQLLAGRGEPTVLLSTPEVPDEGNRAWKLYRRLGFTDVLRHFRFAGDSRPFAVLGRDLPL